MVQVTFFRGSTPYSERIEKAVSVAVATGQRAFFAGRDAYLAPQCILDVTLNGSSASYVPMIRQTGGSGQAWPQPSTANIARGVYLDVGATVGDTVVITYAVRVLNIQPPIPTPVYSPSGVTPNPAPNEYLNFRYGGSPTPSVPDALMTQSLTGLQVEIWRKTNKAGRVRASDLNPSLLTLRSGRHYSPWYRLPTSVETGTVITNPLLDGWASAVASQRRKEFKLAYYDPTSGARTRLSDDTIYTLVSPAARTDRISTLGIVHPTFSLWVAK